MAAGDLVIEESLVRALLEEQHPDLAHLRLDPVDAGWDNVLWRLGADLGVRMPRRMTASWLTDKELRWLPQIAPGLPLPVSDPVRIGAPGCGYPWAWAVIPWLGGQPADREPITDPASATALADFLRALHQPSPPDAPHNPFRGSVPLLNRSAELVEHLPTLADHIDVARVQRIWDDAVAAPAWQGEPVWLHADLHPANVMVTGGALTGVVDFGDMCAGDPANDLAAGWTLLPQGALPDFLASYGDIDEATHLRARGWAVRCAVGIIGIGLAGQRGEPGGKPSWLRGGLATIDRLLAD